VEHVAADAIQHQVDALAVGDLVDLFDEVGLGVVDRMITAEVAGEVEFLGRARRSEHFRTCLRGQLHRSSADAARGGLDQHSLALFEVTPAEQTAVSGQELDREARGFVETHPLRDRKQRLRIGESVLRVAAAGKRRDDAVALVQIHAVTGRIDTSGRLHPRNVRRFGTAEILAAALHDVREVDPGRFDLDADLFGTRFWTFLFLDRQRL